MPHVTITNPMAGETYNTIDKISINLTVKGRFSLKRAEYFVDGRLIGSSSLFPFSFLFIPSELGIETGTHTLRVEVSDAVLNRGESTVRFFVN